MLQPRYGSDTAYYMLLALHNDLNIQHGRYGRRKQDAGGGEKKGGKREGLLAVYASGRLSEPWLLHIQEKCQYYRRQCCVSRARVQCG